MFMSRKMNKLLLLVGTYIWMIDARKEGSFGTDDS
jgi:hypothetical protein